MSGTFPHMQSWFEDRSILPRVIWFILEKWLKDLCEEQQELCIRQIKSPALNRNRHESWKNPKPQKPYLRHGCINLKLLLNLNEHKFKTSTTVKLAWTCQRGLAPLVKVGCSCCPHQGSITPSEMFAFCGLVRFCKGPLFRRSDYRHSVG